MVFYHKFRLPWEKENCILSPLFPPGRVSEWSMVQPWKGCVGASLPGVRIPPLPPTRERGIPLVLLEQTGIFCFSGDVPTLCPPVQNRRRAQYTATFARRAHNETPPVSSAKIGMTTRELEPGMLIFGCKQKVQGPFVPGGPSCRCSALAEAEPLIRGGQSLRARQGRFKSGPLPVTE